MYRFSVNVSLFVTDCFMDKDNCDASKKRARKLPSRYEERNDEKESLPPESARPKPKSPKVQSTLQFKALQK